MRADRAEQELDDRGWVLEEGKRYCGATCHALRPCHELPAPASHAGVTKIAGVGYESRRLAATTGR